MNVDVDVSVVAVSVVTVAVSVVTVAVSVVAALVVTVSAIIVVTGSVVNCLVIFHWHHLPNEVVVDSPVVGEDVVAIVVGPGMGWSLNLTSAMCTHCITSPDGLWKSMK